MTYIWLPFRRGLLWLQVYRKPSHRFGWDRETKDFSIVFGNTTLILWIIKFDEEN
ncbi:MAG: hypothetical protein ACKOX6_16840 [Bdellovibrio sp.]